MADLKISELTALSGANLATDDELAIVDDSASETKKITVSNLLSNGITLISDDTIPGAKILFSSGDVSSAAIADSAVTTAKIADDAVTAAKIADNVIVDLVSTLPASGDYTGQLALDTDDNSLYVWSGSAWLNTKAPGSIGGFTDTSAGIVNITTTVSNTTATITASIDNTTAASQFLAGPVGSSGAVGFRAIDGGDLPAATTTAKGGVIVNGNGLVMDGSTIEIDNSVTASSVNHLVTYDANGLITGGRVIASSDLPVATTSARGAVIASSGLAVDASGNLSIDNTVTSGTYTKVTVTAQGVVSAGETLTADDIPNHSAAKLTSGTIGTSLIANDAVTAAKLADQSTMKFGGATGTDGVTIFPTGDFQGQLFFDETSEDLYFYSGSAFVPITVISGNLVNAGTYNANTNLMTSVTTLGSGVGFAAGAALPAPSANNLNHYVVVDTSGTGTGAAPGVALAPPDMLLSQGVGTEFALIDVSNAIAGQTASNISFVASGTITATDVQAALQEVDSEKVAKAGDTMTGNLNLGDGVVIVFEGATADDYETTLTVADPTADRTITLPDTTGTVVTTGDTGTVSSAMIVNSTIVNADINANAEIAVSKLANGTARQLLQTASNGSDVEFTSNVDVPGTLDVTGAATLDSTLTVTGLISADGKVSFPAGTAAAPSLYSGSDTNTGIYSPGSDQLAISTNGTAAVTVDASQQVGIGITSPGALLHVNSSSSTGRIRIQGGGTSSAQLQLIAGGQTDPYVITQDSSRNLIFFDNASERMRIKSSGNVGIGQTDPAQLLHLTSTGSNAFLQFSDSGSGGSAAQVRIGSNGNDLVVLNNTSSNTATERMRIDSSGKVGIGTASFDSNWAPRLQVSGTASDGTQGILIENYKPAITFKDISGGSPERKHIWADGNALYLGSGDTAQNEQITIDSSGNLGIGATSPGDKLHINKSGFAGVIVQSGRTTTNDNIGSILFRDGGAINASEMLSQVGGNLLFKTAGTEKVRIESSGKVGIGLTPGDSSKLQISGSMRFAGSGSASDSSNPIIYRVSGEDSLAFASGNSERMRISDEGIVYHISTNHGYHLGVTAAAGTTKYIFRGHRSATAGTFNSGTEVYTVWSNGNVQNTNNSYTAISDVKLKENIVDANPQWDDIKALRVRNYNLKEGQTHTQIGVVAQEVEAVSPGLVYESPDQDQEGNDLGTVTKSVNYSVLYMKAVKALQEAMDRIETLEAKVAALEAA